MLVRINVHHVLQDITATVDKNLPVLLALSAALLIRFQRTHVKFALS
jgi:hypothetical protein